VAPDEAQPLLDVVAARLASGQTGSVWQRRTIDRLAARRERERVLGAMLERYLALADTGAPVHAWPVD
jgi:hypothetical protein